MKKYIVGFWYSMPVQLLFLHTRRYQIFLLFWYILFATVNGSFLSNFGAASLFLAPEYLGKVNFVSACIVGFAIGMFIISWNITTFILHSKRIQFLATTAQPFLKYCINNAVLPIIFLAFYFYRAIHFERIEQFSNWLEIIFFVLGFVLGFILNIVIALLYFFTTDKGIYYSLVHSITIANKEYDAKIISHPLPENKEDIRVDWFFSALLKLRKPRDIRHYSNDFLNSIFKRHHTMAVLAILFAFVALIIVGFFSDEPFFQLPAAASITILFAILIAVAGAFSVFLKSWSLLLLALLYVGFNYLYTHQIFDPRNKLYGLDYTNKNTFPAYNASTVNNLCHADSIAIDKQNFIQTLEAWKAKQSSKKPIAFIINVSGGGLRSAAFTVNVLQTIDSILNKQLMHQTIIINGASGGMLGATFYRALYQQQLKDKRVNILAAQHAEAISKDLLNPLFSSFVSRDIIGPVQNFTLNNNKYIKDRGYAFEEKLISNTNGLLNKQLQHYAAAEALAQLPTIIFNGVITRDGRKIIMGTRPYRFLMKPMADSTTTTQFDPDALDFYSFFKQQQPLKVRLSSALRMNATFPYVLPNVWLPTQPVIDVMDAGLRDNYGQETSLRFVENFKGWLQENTSAVVLIQIRDRALNDWDKPLEANSLGSFFTKPFLILQNNWFKIQDYYQHDQLEYVYKSYGTNFKRIAFQYIAPKNAKPAGLSFHLTEAEKLNIKASIADSANKYALQQLQQIINMY